MKKEKNNPLPKPEFDLDITEVLTIWGRPESYTSDACEAVIKAACKGQHMDGWALAAGARSRQTLYNWEDKHPEFKEALAFAKLVNKVYYEKLGTEGTKGNVVGFNAGAWAITMNNKFSDEYNRTGQTTANTTNINFNTLNLSDGEKVARAKTLIYQLKVAGHELGNIAGNTIDMEEIPDD